MTNRQEELRAECERKVGCGRSRKHEKGLKELMESDFGLKVNATVDRKSA